MKLIDILHSPWAISQTRLAEISELYLEHRRREKLDFKAWEAATGRPAGSEREPLHVQDGVAVIPIQGVMVKADSPWNRFCGMTSTQQIRQDVQVALEDPQVHSILLHIDSPGGMVDGTQELADAIFAARAQKPVVAFADGCMCSAACWAGCAAEKVFISSDTAATGSIGVYTTHIDTSRAEEAQGVKYTIIAMGAFKALGHSHAPLSELALQKTIGELNHFYNVFTQSIAKFRGASVDAVLADMADGRVFLGRQAIEVGLVDGVSSLSDLVAQLNQDRRAWKPGAGAALNPTNPTTSMKENPMDLKELREQHPELAKALVEEGRAEGRAQELDRVKGCLDAALLGHEDLARTLALDGKTTPGEAALQINGAENALLRTARDKKGPEPLPNAGDAEAIEAEADRKKAEAAKKPAEPSSLDWGNRITAHITKAAAEGRKLTAAQAGDELRKQDEEK